MKLKKHNITYHFFLFTAISLIIWYMPVTIFSQLTNDKMHYTTAKKYSTNVISSFFAGIDNYTINNATATLQKKTGLNFKKIEVENDNSKDSINIRDGGDGERILICLWLIDYDKRITISVYNMLAKKVLEVYDGTAVKGEDCPDQYTVLKSKLPNGVYLCVVIGDRTRLVGKFIISR